MPGITKRKRALQQCARELNAARSNSIEKNPHPQAYEDLETRGFTEVLLDESYPVCGRHLAHLQTTLKSLSDQKRDEKLFQTDPSKPIKKAQGDGKRRQFPLDKVLAERPNMLGRVKDLFDKAKKEALRMLPNHTVHDPVVIHSLQRCRQQAKHMDGLWRPEPILAQHAAYSAILTVHHESSLRVWPGAHRYFSETSPPDSRCRFKPALTDNPPLHRRRPIQVLTNTLLIFRHDLPHSGSAYKDYENIRIHFNLYAPESHRIEENTVGYIHKSWGKMFKG
jgi:hypothetical protein